jgi:hypothetical protein
MDFVLKAKNYLFSVAARKVIIIVVKWAAAFFASGKMVALQARFGWTLDSVMFQAGAGGALLAALEALEDYLRLRFQNKGGLT